MLQELKAIGLSDKEARVYLAALELGSSTVQEIARKAGINRPTTYVEIESLSEKGLMSSVTKGKKRYYQAESPEQLLRVLEHSRRALDTREGDLKKILPDLKTLFESAEERPKLRFFEGKEGVRAIQEDFLRAKEKTALMTFSLDAVYKVFTPEEIRAYRKRREEKRIRVRGIYTRRGGPLREKFSLMELRFVPAEQFPFKSDVTVYGNKIAIISPGSRIIGVIIESPEIAETFRSIFSLAWLGAQKREGHSPR